MISSLSNYCVIIGCLEYRWKSDPINLCKLHYEIDIRDKKLKEINEIVTDRLGAARYVSERTRKDYELIMGLSDIG